MHMPKKTASEKRLTVRQAYERYLLPDHKRRVSDKTREIYQEVIRSWERHTNDPPIGLIKNSTLAQFRETFMAGGRAPASFNRAWRHLRAILRRVGPPDTGNPLGEGIITKVPYVEMLRQETELPRIATADELDAMYRAAAEMQWPVSFEVAAVDWWRTLLAVGLGFGPRLFDLIRLPTEAFDLEKRTLRFKAHKTRKWHILPFGDVIAAHVHRIASPRALMFAPTGGPNMTGNRFSFYKAWHELQDRAKIQDHFGPHTLRRTCASLYFRHGGYELASYVLGHSARSITMRFYVDPSEALRDWPPEFRAILDHPQSTAVRKRSRSDWSFSIDGAAFHGHPLQLPMRQLAVLRALVAAGRPLSVRELRASVWRDRPAASRQAITNRVMTLRMNLVEQLGLPAEWNPLPFDSSCEGWQINIPEPKELSHASA